MDETCNVSKIKEISNPLVATETMGAKNKFWGGTEKSPKIPTGDGCQDPITYFTRTKLIASLPCLGPCKMKKWGLFHGVSDNPGPTRGK
jgi:hypothetical protein